MIQYILLPVVIILQIALRLFLPFSCPARVCDVLTCLLNVDNQLKISKPLVSYTLVPAVPPFLNARSSAMIVATAPSTFSVLFYPVQCSQPSRIEYSYFQSSQEETASRLKCNQKTTLVTTVEGVFRLVARVEDFLYRIYIYSPPIRIITIGCEIIVKQYNIYCLYLDGLLRVCYYVIEKNSACVNIVWLSNT